MDDLRCLCASTHCTPHTTSICTHTPHTHARTTHCTPHTSTCTHTTCTHHTLHTTHIHMHTHMHTHTAHTTHTHPHAHTTHCTPHTHPHTTHPHIHAQVCSAGSRLLVQEDIHDQLVAKIKERMTHLRVGNNLDKVGCLATFTDSRNTAGYSTHRVQI